MASPAFRFNYLTTEHDRKLVVQAVRKLRDHMAQPSVARRIKDETGEQKDLDSDADILAWASGVAQSNYHPSCTLRMGQGEQSAVDAAGRVHGLDNVRVIDASVFPTIPTANLNAHTIMLAEKLTARLMAEPESMAKSVRNRMQRPNNGVLSSTVPAGPR